MFKDLDKHIGYFAYDSKKNVLCDKNACIIAGTLSSLKFYIKDKSHSEIQFQTRKTNLGEIFKGLNANAEYAFDEESYKIFYPLANKYGFELKEEIFNSNTSDMHFVVIKQ